MATISKKNEPIYIGINNERVELKGAELEAFLEEIQKIQEEYNAKIAEQKAQKELKISAYKKLGLTDEEIAAII